MPKRVINYANRTKRCTICGEKRGPLPLTEFFSWTNKVNGRTYYTSMCKACKREYNRETTAIYRRQNRDKIRLKEKIKGRQNRAKNTQEATLRLRNAQACLRFLCGDCSLSFTEISQESGIAVSTLDDWQRGRHKPMMHPLLALRRVYLAHGGKWTA